MTTYYIYIVFSFNIDIFSKATHITIFREAGGGSLAAQNEREAVAPDSLLLNGYILWSLFLCSAVSIGD